MIVIMMTTMTTMTVTGLSGLSLETFSNLIARNFICDTASRTANGTSETTRSKAESSGIQPGTKQS